MLRFSEFQTDTFDLAIDFYGYEDCPPGYAFGPAIRSNYVIHYITKGRGSFHYRGQVHQLGAGDFFLLKANEVTYYQADDKNPWSYYWFGISGAKSHDYFLLSDLGETGILRKGAHTSELKELMLNAARTVQEENEDPHHYLHLLSDLYEFFYHLHCHYPNRNQAAVHPTQRLFQNAKKIIDTQYDDMDLSIATMAQSLNVNRSYLTSVFKDFCQQSPKEYLLEVRMKRACDLLTATNEPIKIIAYSVGYLDPLHFSKAFKQVHDCSPSQYRQQHTTL